MTDRHIHRIQELYERSQTDTAFRTKVQSELPPFDAYGEEGGSHAYEKFTALQKARNILEGNSYLSPFTIDKIFQELIASDTLSSASLSVLAY